MKSLQLVLLSAVLFLALGPEGLTQEPGSFSYRAQLTFEQRQFESSSSFPNANESQSSLLAKGQAHWNSDRYSVNLGAFARRALVDRDRDFFALTDSNAGLFWKSWSASVGTHIFNWRTLEVFSPMDSLNPINYEGMFEPERIGLPSLVIAKEFGNSLIQAIYIPQTPASFFPQEKNRLGPGVRLLDPEFVTGDFKSAELGNAFQWLLRFKGSYDSFEIDLYHTYKYNTAYPVYAIDIPADLNFNADNLAARPYYLPARQTTAAVQGDWGEWVWKAEASILSFEPYKIATLLPPANVARFELGNYQIGALGLERTFFHADHSATTVYIEGIRAFAEDKEKLLFLGAFTNDAAIGLRRVLNDFKGQEFSALAIGDAKTGKEWIYRLAYEFRPTQHWKFSAAIAVVDAPKPDQNDPLDLIYGLKPIRESDNISIKFSRFF